MRIPTPFTIIVKLLKLALTIIRINRILPITTIIDVKNHLIRRIPPRKFDLTPRRDGLTRPLIARVAATRPGWSSAADCPAAIALLVWGWVVLAAVSTGAVVVDAFEYLGLGCGGTCQWGCCWEGWVLLNLLVLSSSISDFGCGAARARPRPVARFNARMMRNFIVETLLFLVLFQLGWFQLGVVFWLFY